MSSLFDYKFQFGLLLLVVFIMEVAAAISAYVMHGQVTTMLIRTMNESWMAYDDNEYIAKGIDFLQTNVSKDCHVNPK